MRVGKEKEKDIRPLATGQGCQTKVAYTSFIFTICVRTHNVSKCFFANKLSLLRERGDTQVRRKKRHHDKLHHTDMAQS